MSAEHVPVVKMPVELPEPPVALQSSGRRLWDTVIGQFDLEPHDLQMLAAACEAFDIAARHKRKLDKEGLTFRDKLGNPRPHPSCSEHRAALDAYRKLMRELGLGTEPPDSRPPTLPKGYR